MSIEAPLQYEMFSGQLIDARSAYQKRQAREQQRPQQLLMFPIGQVLPFGVSSRPWLKDMPAGQLVLEREDPRTPEEIEHDLIREAQRNTASLFAEEAPASPAPDEQDKQTRPFPHEVRTIGYRARARESLVPVRRRAG